MFVALHNNDYLYSATSVTIQTIDITIWLVNNYNKLYEVQWEVTYLSNKSADSQ
jgi:hypothetical protein